MFVANAAAASARSRTSCERLRILSASVSMPCQICSSVERLSLTDAGDGGRLVSGLPLRSWLIDSEMMSRVVESSSKASKLPTAASPAALASCCARTWISVVNARYWVSCALRWFSRKKFSDTAPTSPTRTRSNSTWKGDSRRSVIGIALLLMPWPLDSMAHSNLFVSPAGRWPTASSCRSVQKRRIGHQLVHAEPSPALVAMGKDLVDQALQCFVVGPFLDHLGNAEMALAEDFVDDKTEMAPLKARQDQAGSRRDRGT